MSSSPPQTPVQSGRTRDTIHPKYRPDIDGLRAIAVLLVVGFHAFPPWFPGGFTGVDIFFVISGVLISTIIFGGLESNQFSFTDFYSRRVRRIFPALITVLLASVAVGWFLSLPEEFLQLGKHIAGSAGFASNFLLWTESGYFDEEGREVVVSGLATPEHQRVAIRGGKHRQRHSGTAAVIMQEPGASERI